MQSVEAALEPGARDLFLGRLERFKYDPEGFVDYAFPWGSPECGPGLRSWQREGLRLLGEKVRSGRSIDEALAEVLHAEPVMIARASGHGIGKSAWLAMVIMWALCTGVDTRGVVTANTESQLKNKTWPELAKWHRMCAFGRYFHFTATSLYSTDPRHEKNWRVDAIAWSVNNTEAFAGLHNKGRRILLVFDEGSAIPDAIWEVGEGALTDDETEIIWLAFGNPTRNTGRFKECFGKFRHRWDHGQIDSRTVEGTNKEQIAKWIADYGEDSDFVRIRVRGVFPKASSLQFIGLDLVEGAMKRDMAAYSPHTRTALVGVDVARFGDDQSVIRTRLQRDARTYPPKKFRELDTMQLAGQVGLYINELKGLGMRVLVFVDGGGIGGAVVDRLRQLKHENIIEVLFGGKADDRKRYDNKGAEMWARCKEWLPGGYLDDDDDLKNDLTNREYKLDDEQRIELEPKDHIKARGLPSPDDADALVLTFAYPSMETQPLPQNTSGAASTQRNRHDPFANIRR